jgi:streptomycin 6-kinase
MTTPKAASEKLAARWNLTLHDCVAETNRARVYKVDGPDGPSALKLYKKLGSAGEGAAVQFLKNLEPGVGVQIYRSSIWRAAVLMEWLEGPSLDELVANGAEDEAVKHLSTVAAQVHATSFNRQFIYRRIAPEYQKELANSRKKLDPSDTPDELHRATQLLDHLVETTTQEHVTHGDLGYPNVILTPTGPRLIDPKGMRSDPALEFAKALTPPISQDVPDDLSDRLDRYAATMAAAINTTPQRLIQWVAIAVALNTFRLRKNKTYRSAMLPLLTKLLDLSDR